MPLHLHPQAREDEKPLRKQYYHSPRKESLRPSLEDSHCNLFPTQDPHHLKVDPLRKRPMVLDKRSNPCQRELLLWP